MFIIDLDDAPFRDSSREAFTIFNSQYAGSAATTLKDVSA
jgi:hypothetical protein